MTFLQLWFLPFLLLKTDYSGSNVRNQFLQCPEYPKRTPTGAHGRIPEPFSPTKKVTFFTNEKIDPPSINRTATPYNELLDHFVE